MTLSRDLKLSFVIYHDEQKKIKYNYFRDLNLFEKFLDSLRQRQVAIGKIYRYEK